MQIAANLTGAQFSVDLVGAAEYGAFCTAHSVPPIPNTRENTLELAGQVGEYDAGTEIARADITMQVGFYTPNGGRAGIKQMIRVFMSWLNPRRGYRAITFNEDPNYYFMAKVTGSGGSDGATILPEGRGGECAGVVDLTLKAADPHWYSWVDDEQTVNLTHASGDVTLNNPGGVSSPPTIVVTATAFVDTGFNITLNGQLLTFIGNVANGDTIIFDCDAWTVTKNGANAISQWFGGFPWVPSGASDVSVDRNNLNVAVSFQPRWLL